MQRRKRDLTQEKLKCLLDYDQNSGVFTWRIRPGTKVSAGDIAGSHFRNGYINIGVYGKTYLLHRLAFFYMMGRWPYIVDHINRDTTDNRWCNLREADESINGHNGGSYSTSDTGIRGVCYRKRTGRFRATLTIRGKRVLDREFPTKEGASIAYAEARERFAYRMANGEKLEIQPKRAARAYIEDAGRRLANGKDSH